jgi:hypothetical protein
MKDKTMQTNMIMRKEKGKCGGNKYIGGNKYVCALMSLDTTVSGDSLVEFCV